MHFLKDRKIFLGIQKQQQQKETENQMGSVLFAVESVILLPFQVFFFGHSHKM